jgi:RNA polymerase sigma-70 factor, ECF subfamily
MFSSPAQPGAGDRFAYALETCRRYLLALANAEMPGQLAAKGGASDIVQETVVAGYLHRDQFHGHTLAELRAWLRVILLNEVASFHRRYRASCRDVTREIPVGKAARGGSRPVTADAALEGLIRAERRQAVAAAVTRLPAEVRAVLVLRLEHGLGFREIGDRLGRTEEAVSKVFSRALDHLRATTPDPAA